MHVTRTLLAVICAGSLLGCPSISDPDDVTGTTTTQAAEALTKALDFEGGELITGLMPSSTSSAVSLIPAASDALEPGASSLMSFDVTPTDAAVDAALIQFEGASGHFLVDSESFADVTGGASGSGAAGDGTAGIPAGSGGSSGGGEAGASGGMAGEMSGAMGGSGSAALARVGLSFKVDDEVCKTLCDRTYQINVTLALGLPRSGVSKHATTTLTLDCTAKGDHARCGADPKTGKGGSVAPAPDGGLQAGSAGASAGSDAPMSDEPRAGAGSSEPVDAGIGAAGADGLPGRDAGTGTGGTGGTGSATDCASLAKQPGLMMYDDALSKWQAASTTPAVRDCSTYMLCLPYTAGSGGCFLADEGGFDTAALDPLDLRRVEAYAALTDAERGCRPTGGTSECPADRACVAGLCQ